MLKRGTRVLVVYSEDDGGRDEFEHHFGANYQAFIGQPGAKLVILPDADHDLTSADARHRVMSEISAMCQAKNAETP